MSPLLICPKKTGSIPLKFLRLFYRLLFEERAQQFGIFYLFSSCVWKCQIFPLCTWRHKTVQLKIHPCLLLALDEVRIRLQVPAALAAEQLLQFPLMGSWVGLRRSGCFGEERRAFPPTGNPKTTFRCPLHCLAWALPTPYFGLKEQFPSN